MGRNFVLTALCLLLATLATWLLAPQIPALHATTFLFTFSLATIASSFSTYVKLTRMVDAQKTSGRVEKLFDTDEQSSPKVDDLSPAIDENSSDSLVWALLREHRLEESELCRWHDDGGALSRFD